MGGWSARHRPIDCQQQLLSATLYLRDKCSVPGWRSRGVLFSGDLGSEVLNRRFANSVEYSGAVSCAFSESVSNLSVKRNASF